MNIEEKKGRGGGEKKGERICRFHTEDKYSSIRQGNRILVTNPIDAEQHAPAVSGVVY